MRNPNGFGSVYKLSGNRRRPWVARITTGWTDEGKQVYKAIGYYKTRKEAQIALAAYNNDPYDVDLKKLTFKQVFERWSEEHFPKISQSKVNNYNTIFKQSEAIHDKAFSTLKTAHFQKLINEKTHLKASTLGHHKSMYFQLYRYAIKNEFVTKNYAEFIELPKTEQAKTQKIFSREEIRTVFAHYEAGTPNADIVLILLFTGFRIMELLKLRKGDVRLSDRYMIGGSKTDAGRERVVPISRKILPLIEARMEQEGELLFPTSNGYLWKYENFRPTVWLPLMQQMGMSHTAHHTRHTFISMMGEAGASKLAIQRIVGHSNRDVTDHYTHLEIRQLIEAIDKI